MTAALSELAAFFRGLFQWWVTIAPWQQGVRVRAGKHIELLGPGIYLRLPMIDAVYMQPIRVRASYLGSQTLTTADGKTIAIAASLRYEIVDLLQLYRTLHNAHDTIDQEALGVVARYVYGLPLSALRAADAEAHVVASLDLAKYGLAIRGFSVTSFAVVRAYRLISGDLGQFTGYDQRIATTFALGEGPQT